MVVLSSPNFAQLQRASIGAKKDGFSSTATACEHVEHFQGLVAVVFIVRSRPERGVLLDYAS